jgi:hypothetical protein
MRIAGLFCLVIAGAAMMPASVAGAQDVVLHLRRAGDTVSIRGAVVTVDHTIEAGNSDDNGTVRVPDLDDGGHIVEVVAHGYRSFEDNFNVGPGVPQPVQLDLIPIAVSDTAKAKGQPTNLTLAGLDGRRAKGQGKFFTGAQLDAAAGRPLANVLKLDAGAVIVSGQGGASHLALRSPAAGSAPCYAAVVRDGLRVYPYPGAQPPDLDKIFPEQLAGIELYAQPASVPAGLGDAGTCGALVLWSRGAAH